ncbi:MAG: hypothetical protein JSV80_16750, partial [Acidobacteriota bacterium]
MVGVDFDKPSLDGIGKKVKTRHLRNSKLKSADVYFVPAWPDSLPTPGLTGGAAVERRDTALAACVRGAANQ